MGRGNSQQTTSPLRRSDDVQPLSEVELRQIDLLEAAEGVLVSKDWGRLAQIAADPDCPPELLEKLADGNLPDQVWEPALRHPKLPRRHLEKLADAYVIDELETPSGRREYREGGIEEDADLLLTDLNQREREAAAQTDSELRTLLSASQLGQRKLSVDERWQLAADPKTSAADLAKLAQDKSAQVRNVVAMNPSTPSAVINSLLWQFDSAVHWRIVDHPNLTQDQRDWIALYELGRLPYGAGSDVMKAQQRMARRTFGLGVSPDTLALIAASNENPYVLAEVAQNKATPPRTLMTLCDPRRPTSVWFEALRHPRLPLRKLEQLAEAPEEWVRETAREQLAARQS